MISYIQTGTVLDEILAHKVEEIAAAKARVPLNEIRARAETQPRAPLDVPAALRGQTVALIAEVKHASPSKGVLAADFDPLRLAETYAENGAAMISVLTDERFFRGHLAHLERIRAAVDLPLLRKDFVLDRYQVFEARAAGADAVLLIVAALADAQLDDLYAAIVELGMTALVEVHTEPELKRALALSPAVIGVNNRDLKTFDVDLNTTARLAAQVPEDVVLVAESGIHAAEDVSRVAELGADAVLVGEALVKAQDTASAVRALSGVPSQRRTR